MQYIIKELDTITQLSSLTHEELLTRLCSEEDDVSLYEEFVKRFHDDLTNECRRICQRRGLDEQVGNQIAHDCFEKVRKYKTIKIDGIQIKGAHKAIMSYLYRVAVNLFNDYQRKIKNDGQINKSYFDELLNDGASEKSPEELLALRDRTVGIFKKLNPKEQKVIITDLEFKRTKNYKYLPDDANELLAQELGVKKDGIRKIRERAIKKIKNAINAD